MGQVVDAKLTMDVRSNTKLFSSKVTANIVGKQNSSRGMENRSPSGDGVHRKKADKVIQFCLKCSSNSECNYCGKTLQVKKEIESTSFHQFKVDITCFVSDSSTDMIVDIGCPNSVIGAKDEQVFKKSLSQFQQDNLRTQKVDSKFKFGPSGPYRCERTLLFPVFDGRKDMFAEISVVNADIPMLLGNNIFRSSHILI